MDVYAHRGASIELPENTLAAFARAIEIGAEGIELDTYRSRDGIAVVIHDDTLDRTTNGTGPVTERTAVELGALDAGNGEHVPTLEKVLALAAGRVRVNIELKDPEVVDAVIAAVARFEDLDWFASGAHWDALAALRERTGAEVYPLSFGVAENGARLIERYRDQLTAAQAANIRSSASDWTVALERALAIGAAGLSIYEAGLTPEIVAAIHHTGLQVWVWTVNDPARALEIAAMGADAICTDAPAEVIAAREAIRTGARPTS
ncbi:glycerophosphodiester phosphodiesterase [Pseudactinotalea suaedae]|uniref:glycerophosphodiester phosphodiesterase n=1 Tax=Pseudactinotalea suaedae TaxID=1524924 RepID=UPI0012E11A89|nr:glycerophosphodiester phosphodiesterase family protein [Pseudactinotalea suaedae]